MSEQENFFTRWSRRKTAAAEKDKTAAADDAAATDAAALAKPDAPASAGDTPADASKATENEAAAPAFDPKNLPPIDSIGAGTDISAFLRAGVPAELARAALRRAWASDPNIRDFVGLSENSWDFTAPDGVPGFGPLSADDAKRLMAEFTGKGREALDRLRALEQPGASAQSKLVPGESGTSRGGNEARDDTLDRARQESAQTPGAIADLSQSSPHASEDTAAQHGARDTDGHTPPVARRHGRALPE
jgi:hypothetical protein